MGVALTQRAKPTARSVAPRSNSFNFAPVLDVPREAGEPCPVSAGRFDLAQLEPGRDVFVRLHDRMRLFRTRTRDFADAEVMAVKRELGQVYADVSGKVALDDFARDLRKLVLGRECRQCELSARCAGCFHARRTDVFSAADARVREILAGLAGDVLDVGCGEGPYLDALAEGARRGSLRYLGLDPDAQRIALLRSRYPWADYHEGSLQSLTQSGGQEPRFDHVLILRSYNHLPDPAIALDAAVALLRDGGTLLVVDNVAFGVVRTEQHVARAEAGPATFEHFRNDSSGDAAALLSQRPLDLLERRDVTPSTGNQWLLRYQRTTEASP